MTDPDRDPDVVYYRRQMAGLEEHIHALEAELGSVRGQLDDRTTQLVRLRCELDTLQWAERLALKNAARTVPTELEWAMRDAPPAGWHSAWIPLGDGKQMLITVGGPRAATEAEVWRYLEASYLKPVRGHRIGPFIRADLPRPLAAYVDEQDNARPSIVLGTWLNCEATDAARAVRLSWLAHRPGRSLWGIVFPPLLVALRGLRDLIPSQAALSTATGITASAMPLISAAVISSPTTTSLDVAEQNFQRGPTAERFSPVDSHSPLPTLPRRTTKKSPRKTRSTSTSTKAVQVVPPVVAKDPPAPEPPPPQPLTADKEPSPHMESPPAEGGKCHSTPASAPEEAGPASEVPEAPPSEAPGTTT